MSPKRKPQETQAWLVGGGIASLAAAVHLLKKAKVPAHQIHILDIRHSSGGAMKSSGNCVDGYVLHTGALPYLRGQCVADLLSMVPSAASPTMSYLQDIKSYECYTRPINRAHTRAIKRSDDGIQRLDEHQLRVGAKIRRQLVRFLFDGERFLEAKQIDDIFDDSFFVSEFWALWSTTFLLQPWHSAIEFHRLLVKHLPDMNTENDVRRLERTQFSLYESLVFPITAFLKDEGVDFHFHTVVTDIKMYPERDPRTVQKIVLTEQGKERAITVAPNDIVIVTLGSLSTGWKTGSNEEHPQSPSPLLLGPEWTLWQRLHQQSPKFGDPTVFSSRVAESTIETFTITLREADFFSNYSRLTQDNPGTGALLTVLGSPWGLNISVPSQPVFRTQPNDMYVIWGYALLPDQTGAYVPKPMKQCSGREILLELLSHLGFPTEQILSSATTIPCLVPLGTSVLLSRKENDRPRVVPHGTTNIAFLGQYVEIPGDTTFGVEYSVRGAAMAVHTLMGLTHGPPVVRRSKLLEVFELLC